MLVLQLGVLLVLAGLLTGMFVFTDVYNEVRERIVRVLCLSCIKLQPYTIREFTFTTANNASHPDFVLENLTKGPVFLEYSEDACPACDTMHPVIEQLFNVSYEKDQMFSQTVTFQNQNITFIYINIDHTTSEMRSSQFIYDKDHISGLPMFSVVTLGNDNGIVKPYYTSVYGTLNLNTNNERIQLFTEIIQNSITIYQENVNGFHQDH